MKLLFATGNRNKLNEAREILNDFDIEQFDIDLPEHQGDAGYIVSEKAKFAFKRIKKPLFVEDTSFEFNALNGFPGPYIKDLVTRNDIGKIPKILNAFKDKSAQGISLIAFIEDENNPILFKGRIEGKVVESRGESGFAWDSIFEPTGFNKTFAEMNTEKKNQISHRMKAFLQFRKYLKNKYMIHQP